MSTKCIKKGLATIAMMALGFNVVAFPMLTFDGTMAYEAETNFFTIEGGLTSSQEIVAAPILAGSSFQLFSKFTDATITNLTVANFIGVDGVDLIIRGGDDTLLLEAELSGLQMRGANDLDFGILAGMINPTGGVLESLFSVDSELFALELNLTSVFGGKMFLSDFSGLADGSLTSQESVPEPDVFVLLMLGLALLLIARGQKLKQQFGMQGRIS